MKDCLKFAEVLIFSLFFVRCGLALTPRATVKVPPRTESEIFRLNLYEGKVKNLYGINVGIFNDIESSLVGWQIGILNNVLGKKNTDRIQIFYGVQTGLMNDANYVENPVVIQIAALANYLKVSAHDRHPPLIFQFGLWSHTDNSSTSTYGVTVGLLGNIQEAQNSGLNIGLLNVSAGSKSSFGLNLGGLNLGMGVNVGIVNLGGPVSFGVLNYGDGLQVGLLNICGNFGFGGDRSFLPFMFLLNYCKPR